MSPVKPPTRSTRQGTTRASTQARREISPGSETHVQTPPPEPESRSRRSTSPISSLSPSPQKIAHRLPIPPPSSSSTPVRVRRDKGKGKAVEPSQAGQGEAGRPGKRVLPARIRRAAGGGQEGFRDLEHMIVDWLDRYGYPSDTPPDNLRITITSLPLDLVDPPVSSTGEVEATEQITITPHNEAGPSTRREGMIETPDWIKVEAGQDDQEEAREELISHNPFSPVRRLRRLSNSNEHGEDTSDEYYHRLHKKYESIEKRQRKDERDKLAFERYKMRTRIDLLRSISSHSWSSVVWTVLAREDPTGLWVKGKQAVQTNGIEWLRRRLVKEGEEVMKRYDRMLPVDPRKSKVREDPTSVLMSQSPPPTGLPARVAALKQIKDEAAERRRSLPVQPSSSESRSSKRRRSEGAVLQPRRESGRNRYQRATITVKDEDEISDTDSEPLSDAPSESDTEPDMVYAVQPLAIDFATSSSSSAGSSIAVAPRPQASQITRVTRTSTRIQPPRKSPSRTSARIKVSVAAALSPPPALSAVPPVPVQHNETNMSAEVIDEMQWEACDLEQRPLNYRYVGSGQGQMQIQDEVTLDEQLDLERVEAAVVI